ncbi:flagellar filament capping protein FliD [Paraburkholderia unamae]|uniref:Flagellar hook-associated protein 2 n=1 Tax=Paraburkholderia unamae TaxID=219649 RepID=A0ABX5KEX8_9BURK|nr:flagellar filament capping protein FliD [Paraburkholderia unamae]PVX71260.1 flagellar hook-associated protein 2 [Paraburkholderia unamae]CAG9243900.1 Flagellar hook-associated protein 2 [Paraburkholderia unamae]
MASTITNTTASANSVLSDAAQSIISGATNSALDVNQLVKALVNAKMAGPSAALAARQTASNTTLSAFGTLKSSLASLQTALEPFKDGAALQRFTVTASEKDKGLSAVAGKSAVAGSYTVEVDHLATAHKLASDGFDTGATLGTGALDISMGGKSMHLTIAAGSNTLSDIAAAINRAADNPGVTASIVNGTDGQHLVLSSTKTGAANAIEVSADAGLDARLGSAQMREVVPAGDAELHIDGTRVTSASNTLEGVVSDLTIKLESASVGTKQTLTIAPDMTATGTAIRDFVKAYNSYVDAMSGLTSFTAGTDSSSSHSGALLGDSVARMLSEALPAVIANGVKGGDGVRHSLGEIGIKLDKTGKLEIDDKTFDKALQPDNRAIATLFGSGGIPAKLDAAIKPYVQSSGIIERRTDALNKELNDIKQQSTTLEARAALLTTKFNRQFTALNTLMTTMNNNAQYLTQLFGGANSAGALATNHK